MAYVERRNDVEILHLKRRVSKVEASQNDHDARIDDAEKDISHLYDRECPRLAAKRKMIKAAKVWYPLFLIIGVMLVALIFGKEAALEIIKVLS